MRVSLEYHRDSTLSEPLYQFELVPHYRTSGHTHQTTEMATATNYLPPGFVYLDQVDSTIISNMMYYGTQNFIGEPIPGYIVPRIILTLQAALALKQVQDSIRSDNYSLILYDSYRPTKAVSHFVDWARDLEDIRMKPAHYPYVNKSDLFSLGYIAERSGHSRGSTVDLSIIEIGKEVNPKPIVSTRELKDGRKIPYLDDNSADMFTSVDLFDEASWHDQESLIKTEYLERRNYLRRKMQEFGFNPYSKEWWHYTLSNEPFPDTYFDFDIGNYGSSYAVKQGCKSPLILTLLVSIFCYFM